MLTTVILAFVTLAGVLSGAVGDVNFDSAHPGSLPQHWSVGAGTGGSSEDRGHSWVVRTDSSAPSRKNVLESTGSGDAPAAIFDPVVCRDGELSVKFRI